MNTSRRREIERILKALANDRRLHIVQYLKKQGEAAVGDIADEIRVSFRSTSKHLSVLAAADIVEKEQRSTLIYYRLGDIGQRAIKAIASIT